VKKKKLISAIIRDLVFHLTPDVVGFGSQYGANENSIITHSSAALIHSSLNYTLTLIPHAAALQS